MPEAPAGSAVLLLVTGARRGEMCALRWTDEDEAEQYLLIEGSYLVRRGARLIKDTKTHQKRRLTLDSDTLEMLKAHRDFCQKRAEQAGGALEEDGYVFSRDGFGELPWVPDSVGHWFREFADAADVKATIKSLRQYKATVMLTGGIDLRTAAGRLGHSGGGHITLRVYAPRTARPISAPPRCSLMNSGGGSRTMAEPRIGRADAWRGPRCSPHPPSTHPVPRDGRRHRGYLGAILVRQWEDGTPAPSQVLVRAVDRIAGLPAHR